MNIDFPVIIYIIDRKIYLHIVITIEYIEYDG